VVKYINGDSKAVKNMSLIVYSYIKNYKKHIPFIIGLLRKSVIVLNALYKA